MNRRIVAEVVRASLEICTLSGFTSVTAEWLRSALSREQAGSNRALGAKCNVNKVQYRVL